MSNSHTDSTTQFLRRGSSVFSLVFDGNREGKEREDFLWFTEAMFSCMLSKCAEITAQYYFLSILSEPEQFRDSLYSTPLLITRTLRRYATWFVNLTQMETSEKEF